MTKAHSATTPTLQSFFPSQKAPNTRSRTKSLKTPLNSSPISPALAKRKLAAASTPPRESPCPRTGTKRRAEGNDVGAESNTTDTGKRRKLRAADSLTLTPTPRIEELSEPETPNASESLAADTPSKAGKRDSQQQDGLEQMLGTPTPSCTLREPVSRSSAPGSAPSRLKYAVIETPRRTSLQQALPSPGGEESPEIHDPREQPSRLSLPTTPISSPAKPVHLSTLSRNLLEASSIGQRPAHQRFKHLLNPSSKLPLPQHYLVLEKMFLGLEGSATISRARGERCIYHKIRKAVEYQCGRNFEMRNLAQIRTVYPEAYTYAHITTINQGVRVSSVCIDVPDESKRAEPVSPSPKTPNSVSSVVRGGAHAAPILSAMDSPSMLRLANSAGNRMQHRRLEFHARLEKMVRTAHAEFLKTIAHSPPGADSKLRAWHPQFDLDSMPEIEPADMPELREALPDFRSSAAKARSAHEAKQNGDPPSAPVLTTPRASKNSENSENASETRIDAQIATPPSKGMPAVMPAPPTKPKSGSAAILERIRERARKKAEAEMYGPRKDTPAEIRKKAMLSRLGLVAQALNFIYAVESKNVLNITDVVRRLANSLKASLSEAEALEHLKLLAQVAPEYCELTDLSLLGTQVRIHRSVAVATVNEKIAKVVADMDKNKILPRVAPETPGTPTPS
ncbi:replication licensing factor Cdt1 [Geranomyces variabilis]|uniref:Replication licensing factor Cdt1 n=1 Tax=Geranomyces variabilis TaxID=109894 RepID=A0AAD5TQM3_9FUNG|nr:replication licensing factor Cdt1 [Geranomyces variabilis]